MGTSHSKRKWLKRVPRRNSMDDAKGHICSSSSSSRDVKPLMEERSRAKKNRLPNATVLESWTVASSSSVTSSTRSLSSSSMECRHHPQQHLPQPLDCRRLCSCSLPVVAADAAAHSDARNRYWRPPLSSTMANENVSLDVSHASDDVSVENADNAPTTDRRRIRDNAKLQDGGSGWRTLAWIIDMCIDGRKNGSKKWTSTRSSSSNNNCCKCSISGRGVKSSTMPAISGKIDKRQRECACGGAKRTAKDQNDRVGSTCTRATGAVSFSDVERSREKMPSSMRHHLQQQQQAILGYDDKTLADIIRLNMIKNNVFIPSNRSRHHIKGGGRRCGGDGGGGKHRCWQLEATVEPAPIDEHHNCETNVYFSVAEDNEGTGANCESLDWYAKPFRHLCCTLPKPNNDDLGPSIRLRIVHKSNDTHYFGRRITSVLPRRRSDPIPSGDVVNYLDSSIQDGRLVTSEAVMSPCHYWHRHRHRERNQRRAMNRVAEWIMRDEENASQDVARKRRTVFHSFGHNCNNRYYPTWKHNHHRRHNGRHVMVRFSDRLV